MLLSKNTPERSRNASRTVSDSSMSPSDPVEFVDSVLELVRKKSLDNEVFEDPISEGDLDLEK